MNGLQTVVKTISSFLCRAAKEMWAVILRCEVSSQVDNVNGRIIVVLIQECCDSTGDAITLLLSHLDYWRFNWASRRLGSGLS